MDINGTIYDKIINVTFFSNNIQNPKKTLITPNQGFKPSINLNGMIIANSFFCNIELRIKNAFIDFDFGPYQSVSIDAGYAGDLIYSGLSGQITQAYVETPGPDGVTVFIVKITYQGILENYIDFEFDGPGTFEQILNKFISDMNSSLNSLGITSNYTIFIPTELRSKQFQSNIHISGSISNTLVKIVEEYMQCFWSINGQSIVVFNKQFVSNKNIFEITRVTTTPRSTAPGHISFTAPWLPNLRPGDCIHINPIYLKASFGTFQALKNKGDNSEEKLNYSPGYFSIYSISFEFDTFESINTMIVDALNNTNVDINTGLPSTSTPDSQQIGKL